MTKLLVPRYIRRMAWRNYKLYLSKHARCLVLCFLASMFAASLALQYAFQFEQNGMESITPDARDIGSDVRQQKGKILVQRRTALETYQKDNEKAISQLRCSALFLGCFCQKASSIISTVLTVKKTVSVQQCFYSCSKRGAKLSALEGTSCLCAHRIAAGATIEHSAACNRTLSLPTSVSCTPEEPALELYFIPSPCTSVEVNTDSVLEIAFVGNVQVTPKHLIEATSAVADDVRTPLQCLLFCEASGQTLSMINSKQKCHCGQTTTRLSRQTSHGRGITSDENLVAVYRTSVPDYRCASRRFLPRGSFQPVALVSRPGSGNTWLRYLIESATGTYTGSVYNDVGLVSKGFLGEFGKPNSGRTLVFKDHTTTFRKYTRKAIVLIRDPYDVCVAEFNRRRTSHTGLRDQRDFLTKQWADTCNRLASRWLWMNKEYIAAAGRVLVVYYENLLQDYCTELRKIIEFLGVVVQNLEDRLLCVEDNSTGYFKRKNRGKEFDPFVSLDFKVINEYIATLRRHFSVRNLPTVPKYEK